MSDGNAAVTHFMEAAASIAATHIFSFEHYCISYCSGSNQYSALLCAGLAARLVAFDVKMHRFNSLHILLKLQHPFYFSAVHASCTSAQVKIL